MDGVELFLHVIIQHASVRLWIKNAVILEPVNTWSNLAYVICGLLLVKKGPIRGIMRDWRWFAIGFMHFGIFSRLWQP